MDLLNAFKRQVTLMCVSGIPVRADLRWFLVLAVLSAITAASINERVGNLGVSLIFGSVTTLVFFLSIFIHEFAHAAAARLEDLEVIEIVLHPFGGLTRFRHEPETPRAEFRIAVAGPAASFILTLVFLGLMAAANAAQLDILAILLFLLALANFLIAVFNMFPGYPLDGGRVLRAYLWKSGRDLNESTILTGRCGQAIAVGLGILGLAVIIIRGEYFTGFWAVLVGIFLYDSAKSIIQEVRASEKRRVEDVMWLPISVEPDATVTHFVENILPMHPQASFPVARDRQMFGMLLLEDMKAVPRGEWSNTRIGDIMRPVTPDLFVETNSHISEAEELMRANGAGAVGVIDSNGRLVGFLKAGTYRRPR